MTNDTKFVKPSTVQAIVRFAEDPPTGSWETIATFHGLLKRQWNIRIKIIASQPDGTHVVEMEPSNAPSFRGDEAIEIFKDYHGASIFGKGRLVDVKMTDKKLLDDAVSHIQALIIAVDHAERFSSASATGCRERAKVKTKASNFVKKYIVGRDSLNLSGTMYDPPLPKPLSKLGESPCGEISLGPPQMCFLRDPLADLYAKLDELEAKGKQFELSIEEQDTLVEIFSEIERHETLRLEAMIAAWKTKNREILNATNLLRGGK